MKISGREIVQVQGGHILRSSGRKDRHSRVFSAKGPRDRRIRLSAHTAIQFYDVQDRLGYDRPSKAVDWLINKAKNAIDNLDELPPWNPNDTTRAPSIADPYAESSSGYAFQMHTQLSENHPGSSTTSLLLPPSLETQSISDTMKSFFPMNSGTSSMNFQDYPHDIMSRTTTTTTIQTQDLCLSLHPLQDPSSSHTPSTDQTLYPGSAPLTFEANYPRLVAWNEGRSTADSREGYMFSSQSMSQQPFLCQTSGLPPRGPLQSSFLPSVHAWDVQTIPSTQQSSISNSQFTPQGVLQFQVPSQIRSEEHRGVVSNKPPSPSPNSHH